LDRNISLLPRSNQQLTPEYRCHATPITVRQCKRTGRPNQSAGKFNRGGGETTFRKTVFSTLRVNGISRFVEIEPLALAALFDNWQETLVFAVARPGYPAHQNPMKSI
jgi:hypothetical protein